MLAPNRAVAVIEQQCNSSPPHSLWYLICSAARASAFDLLLSIMFDSWRWDGNNNVCFGYGTRGLGSRARIDWIWIGSNGNGIQLNNSFERNHWEFVRFAWYLLINSSLPHLCRFYCSAQLAPAPIFRFVFFRLHFAIYLPPVSGTRSRRMRKWNKQLQLQVGAAAAASGTISIRSTRDDRLAFLATTNDKVYLENDILNSNGDNDDCTIENSRDKTNGSELVLWANGKRMRIRFADASLCTVHTLVVCDFRNVRLHNDGWANSFTSPDQIHSGPDTCVYLADAKWQTYADAMQRSIWSDHCLCCPIRNR